MTGVGGGARESGAPIEVLLVEDDPGDVLMTQEAFEEHYASSSPHHHPTQGRNRLAVVSDGAEALSYLRQEGQYAGATRPDLILLDLNLPRRDGREVLAEIKTDDNLRRIPVVVLTTSQADEDILRSYQLHANAYVTKPVDFDQFIAVVRQIDDFFVSVVKLPPRN
jgi:CheY-like chemotaxis protein